MTTTVLLTAATSGTTTGFESGSFGTVAPTTLLTYTINRFYKNSSGNTLTLRVTGEVEQDLFESLRFTSNQGEELFYTADATYTSSGGNTSWVWTTTDALFTAASQYTLYFDEVGFNCHCEDASGFRTLAELRTSMLALGGYAAMASNPPPGILVEIDEHLRNAQRELYRKHTTLRMGRFFKWTMVPGQRFYGFADEEGNCKELDVTKIAWVGYEDLNQAWYPLVCGIDPTMYTRVNTMTGYPQRYEIRSCIEIWPAPQAAYTLWVKGDFGLDALTATTDRTSVDDQAVFLLALGNMLTSKNKPNAASVMAQASNYVLDLVASTHKTRRYVPRRVVEPPAVLPRFLPLGDDPS